MSVKPPPGWMIRLNAAFLRRGLRLGSQYLLTVRGRRTGDPRSTPISIAVIDGERYIVAAFARAAWVANVRAAGEGALTRGGHTEHVTLIELPVEDRGPILRAFLEQVRGGVRFFGRQTTDEIVGGADRYPVFRVATRD
jgi:deazaflavin-dependent oxidoreductase (nitroreductase family)